MRYPRVGHTLLVVIAVVLLAAGQTQPAVAAANGSFTSFTPNAGSGCVFGIGSYSIQVDGTTDDGGGVDYVAVILRDALGNYGDNDFWNMGASASNASFGDATGFNSPPAARPFTLELYDIGSPGGTVADSPAGIAITLAGTLLATYTFDPAGDVPACASLPLYSAPAPAPTQASGSAEIKDGRVNSRDLGAPLAVYCPDGLPEIYSINSEGVGSFAFAVTQAQIDAVGVPEVNTVVAEGHGIRLIRLTSGEFQVVSAPDFEGKVYQMRFAVCAAGAALDSFTE